MNRGLKEVFCSCDQLIEKMNVFKKDLEAWKIPGLIGLVGKKRLGKVLETVHASGRKRP